MAELTPLLRENVGFGTFGREIRVKTNLASVSIDEAVFKNPVFQYDVDIYSETGGSRRAPQVRVRRAVFDQFLEQHKDGVLRGSFPVYDGTRIMFSKTHLELEGDEKTFDLELVFQDEEREREKSGAPRRGRAPAFKIAIKYTRHHNPEDLLDYVNGRSTTLPQNVLQVFDIAFRHDLLRNLPSNQRRTVYMTDQGSVGERNAAQFWPGFSFAFRVAIDKLLFSVNYTTAAFYKPGNMIDYVKEFFRTPNPVFDDRAVQTLRRNLRGVKFTLTHDPRRKTRQLTVGNVTSGNARTTTFMIEKDGREQEMSVEQYFADKYGVRLRYPQFPLVTPVGQKTSYFPLECADIAPGQPLGNDKLDGQQRGDLIRHAALHSEERFRANRDALQRMVELTKNRLQPFGVNIRVNDFGNLIPARELPPPTLVSQGGRRIATETGQWNMRNHQFVNPGNLDSIAFLSLASRREFSEAQFDELVREFLRGASSNGIRVKPDIAPFIAYADYQVDEDVEICIENVMKTYMDATNNQIPSLLVCVLREKSKTPYKFVKRACMRMGIISQCAVVKSMYGRGRNIPPQYVNNLLLKVNTKLGGSNVHVDDPAHRELIDLLNREKTMFVGADLSHGSAAPGVTGRGPSFASITASVDKNFVRFTPSIKAQIASGDLEMIHQVGEMFATVLDGYYSENKDLPESIVWLRDGVSEGQFTNVGAHEIASVKLAAREYAETIRHPAANDPSWPKVTYIIAQKRHAVRLFPDDPRAAQQFKGNVRPGTVVDREVSDPRYVDWYLVSHVGLKGTSRPSRYICLQNENVHFNADVMQRFVNMLCYLFARSNTAVSVAPPIYYSHLLAVQGKLIVEASPAFTTWSSGVGSEVSIPGRAPPPPAVTPEWMIEFNNYQFRRDVMWYV